MTWSLALFSYIVIWCITWLAVLPFRLGRKNTLITNTLLAAAITFALHLLLLSGWIPLRGAFT